ncbi:MAG: SpoIIE family protein phosphatase [Candidatus Promineifilaceae bacterium]
MTTLKSIWRNYFGRKDAASESLADPEAVLAQETAASTQLNSIDLDIAPNDPLLTYVRQNRGVLDVEELKLESEALETLRQANIKAVVPLVSQGELIGLINLGARLSEQEYSRDDYSLLNDLATQAAPALRVAQLVQQQKIEAAERERIQHELQVARLIQQTLLPQELPDLDRWSVTAYYQPARAVGGDFYDFLYLSGGKVGFIVADVTDKGIPAALVMATTRTLLRAAAERLETPGAVLARTNDVLVKEIPPKMFVTCFYAILDPLTGHLCYANAGHDVPYRYTQDGVQELRARGMPLGLMPGMQYEEKETMLRPGEYAFLYSDGLVEAHDPTGEMFGFPKLQDLLADHSDGDTVNDFLLEKLEEFTGKGWEQEDDVTLLTLQYEKSVGADKALSGRENGKLIANFEVVSAPGNERLPMQQVSEALGDAGFTSQRLERLKTAVAEATMNAMEHGNHYDPDKSAKIKVYLDDSDVRVTITDHGGGAPLKVETDPDIDAKLAGEESPRGWGLFLIQNMVDEMDVHQDEHHHTIELVMHLEDEQGEKK